MSENYIVSARKYRPLTFDTVVGQSHITTTLKNAIKHQQLAHAFLFCGPRGVGKTTCARILAKTINCEHPTEDMEACGTCQSCIGFKNNSLFNVFELDAASNNSVEDIRELTNQVRFAPQQGKYKVYIIDEVHMLSASAFNAFLKTLEEPPPYAIFILATTEKHKILPTILSRCQIFDFKRITTHDIVEHLQGIALKEGMQAEDAALHIIAQKSEGCMRDALSMLDRISGFTNGLLTYSNTMEHLNLLDADFYFQLTDCLLAQDVAGTLLLLDKALEKGFEGDTIIAGLAEHFRNLLLCKDERMAKLLDVPADHKPIFYNKANLTPPSFLISSLGIINSSELEYNRTANKRLHIEMCLIRLCYVLQATLPNNNQLADEKKNFDSIAPQPEKRPNLQVENSSNSNSSTNLSEPTTQGAVPAQIASPVLNTENNVNPVKQVVNTVQPTINTNASGNESSPARRLSRNTLDKIKETVKQAETNNSGNQKELTQEDISRIFELYKQNLQSSGQSINYAQFSLMRVEFHAPDEVKIIASDEFSEGYAKNERSALIDLFCAETKRTIRITTLVVADENAGEQKIKILSRNEMFEAMALKNPNLSKLKELLNLQIEY